MNILLTVTLAIGMSFTTPKGDVTSDVKKYFETKFQSASSAKWVKENAHEYEVNFLLNGTKCSANFSDKGEWIESEVTIKYNELPDANKNSFRTIKTTKIVAVAKMETAKSEIKYEIEYKQGTKTKDVFYHKEGKKI